MANNDEVDSKKEDWVNSKWRPCLGWLYLAVCGFDFIVAPVLWSVLNMFTKGSTAQWAPLTLQGAGLFHISMGAVLGIAAYGRTQEKLSGANNGGLSIPSMPGMPTTPSPTTSGGFGVPASGGFGSPAATSSGFSAPAAPASSGFSAPATSSFSAPAATPEPSTTAPPSTGFSATIDTPVASVTVNAGGKKIVPITSDPVI
jgi:hypothetical protein